MRLYDQSSSTPMKMDGSKWMRPNNFLPRPRKTSVAKPMKNFNENHSASAKMVENANCGSETSASTAIEITKVYKHHTIYDDFRFDIDEDQDLSMNSSSTLSTHSTLRQVTQDPYNEHSKEIPKPIAVAKNGVFDSGPRYSRSSSQALHTSIIAMSAKEIFATELGDVTRYLMQNDEDGSSIDDDLLTPKLTHTQSSEEGDSLWIEFAVFGSKNPFRARHDMQQSNKQKLASNTSTIDHQYLEVPQTNAFDTKKSMVPSRYIMTECNGNYTKYYKMLLDGTSVDDVSKVMERDLVDPSIISLVLAASQSS